MKDDFKSLGKAWEKLGKSLKKLTGHFSRERQIKISNLLPKQGKLIKINWTLKSWKERKGDLVYVLVKGLLLFGMEWTREARKEVMKNKREETLARTTANNTHHKSTQTNGEKSTKERKGQIRWEVGRGRLVVVFLLTIEGGGEDGKEEGRGIRKTFFMFVPKMLASGFFSLGVLLGQAY